MLEIRCTCQYCGNSWTLQTYSKGILDYEKCSVCQDKNIKFEDLKSKINYYEGAPEFETTDQSIDKKNRQYLND